MFVYFPQPDSVPQVLLVDSRVSCKHTWVITLKSRDCYFRAFQNPKPCRATTARATFFGTTVARRDDEDTAAAAGSFHRPGTDVIVDTVRGHATSWTRGGRRPRRRLSRGYDNNNIGATDPPAPDSRPRRPTRPHAHEPDDNNDNNTISSSAAPNQSVRVFAVVWVAAVTSLAV